MTDQTVNYILAVIAAISGTGGGAVIIAWVKKKASRLMSMGKRIDKLESEKTEMRQELADLKKKIAEHEQKDAIEAMIFMGFLEVGEDATLLQDHDGNTLFISPALCKILGLTQDEATNGAWKEAIHIEDRERAVSEWKEFVAGRRSQRTLKFRIQKISGSTPWTPVKMKLVRKSLAMGGVERIVGLVSIDTSPQPNPTLPQTPPEISPQTPQERKT